jgi:rubrerythrin
MVNVCRDSQQTKVRDLLAAVPDLIDEMNHNEELSRATLQITPKKLMYLKDFSTLIGLIINLTYLLNASRKYHYRELDVEDWVIDTIEIFGYI